MSSTSPSADNPDGLSGSALENFQRDRRVRILNEKKAAEAATAAAAASSGDADAISDDGGDAHDEARQASETARNRQLRADTAEAAGDLDAVELSYDNFLNNCRKNMENRSLTDIVFTRRQAQNDDWHREASDALQVLCEVTFELSGDQDAVDNESSKHRDKLDDLWHAVDHTLREHKARGRPRYEHPADRRSPSVGSRDSGHGAFQRGEGWTDGGPPRPAPAAAHGGDNGVRFANPRVRHGPLAQSYGAGPRDESQERERRDFESTRHEYTSKYETPDERNRRQREQRDADARAREEDSARSQRALSRTPARVGAYPGVAPPAPDEAYHEDYAVFANNTNSVDDTPTPEVSKRLLSALQFLQRAQPKLKGDKADTAPPVGYSGRGQSLTDFHRQLTDSCSSAALPYDQYWHVFRHVLHASARSFYDGLPPDERRSFQTTFVRLRAYFEPHVMQMDTLSEYWNCKQGKSQSVESYAEELTHLRRLVPTDTESERALVHRFLTNLYDSRVVRDVKMTYPKTLEEAVSKARQSASTFANTGDADPRRPPVLLTTEADKEELNFDAEAEVVLAINQGRPPPFQCERCGNHGHHAVWCSTVLEPAQLEQKKAAWLANRQPRTQPRVPPSASQRACYNCGAIGHLIADCKAPPKPRQQRPVLAFTEENGEEYSDGSFSEGDLDKYGEPLCMLNGTPAPLYSCSQEQFDMKVRENQISFVQLQLCAPDGRSFQLDAALDTAASFGVVHHQLIDVLKFPTYEASRSATVVDNRPFQFSAECSATFQLLTDTWDKDSPRLEFSETFQTMPDLCVDMILPASFIKHHCVVFDPAQNHYVFQLAPREVAATPAIRRRAADLVEILAQPDMLNVVQESSKEVSEAAETAPTPLFDGKIQANTQKFATPVDVPVPRVLETSEFSQLSPEHIAIGTSESNFHAEFPPSLSLDVSSVLPQQVVLEHMLPPISALQEQSVNVYDKILDVIDNSPDLPQNPSQVAPPFSAEVETDDTPHGTAGVLANGGPLLVEIIDEANWDNILNVDAPGEHAVEVFPASAPSVFARNDLPPPPPEPPPARAKSPHQETTSNVPNGESSFTDFPPFRKGRRGLREHPKFPRPLECSQPTFPSFDYDVPTVSPVYVPTDEELSRAEPFIGFSAPLRTPGKQWVPAGASARLSCPLRCDPKLLPDAEVAKSLLLHIDPKDKFLRDTLLVCLPGTSNVRFEPALNCLVGDVVLSNLTDRNLFIPAKRECAVATFNTAPKALPRNDVYYLRQQYVCYLENAHGFRKGALTEAFFTGNEFRTNNWLDKKLWINPVWKDLLPTTRKLFLEPPAEFVLLGPNSKNKEWIRLCRAAGFKEVLVPKTYGPGYFTYEAHNGSLEDLPFPTWDLVSFSGTSADIQRAKDLGLQPENGVFDVPTTVTGAPQLFTESSDGHVELELPYVDANPADVSFLDPSSTDVAFLFSQSPRAQDTPTKVQKERVPPKPGEPTEFGLTPLELNKRKLACCPGGKDKVSVENINSLDCFEGLSAHETQQLRDLCLEKECIQIFNDDNVAGAASRFSSVKHHIDFKADAHTARLHVSPSRFSPREYELTDQVLNQMLGLNVIEPAGSPCPYSARLVFAKKPDGSIRPCVDYRPINAVTIADIYPLPRIDTILDRLGGMKYASTIDLSKGFWQIDMAEDDKQKTAFATHRGLFQFRVMPFGLRNAPATFQRLMDTTLSGLTWLFCMVYLDDIIVWSRSFDEHVVHLRAVFRRLAEAGLKVSPKKVHLGYPELALLGHVINQYGVKPNPAKIEAILAWEPPADRKGLESFLGLTNYYSRLIDNYAALAAPLTDLRSKEVPYDLLSNPARLAAFQSLKNALCSDSVMIFHPDYNEPFRIECDASNQALGAALLQLRDGLWRPVGYASRKCRESELKYPPMKLECASMHFGLSQFRHYVLGAKDVQVVTDQGALPWLYAQREAHAPRNLPKMLEGWINNFSEYEFSISHRAGVKQVLSDALSRLLAARDFSFSARNQVPVLGDSPDDAAEDSLPKNVFLASPDINVFEIFSSSELAAAQKADTGLQFWFDYVTKGVVVPRRAGHRRELFQYHKNRMSIVDNVLVRRLSEEGEELVVQKVVPSDLRPRVLHYFHCSLTAGHLGADRMEAAMLRSVWWPEMRDDIRRFTDACECKHVSSQGRQRPERQHPLGEMDTGPSGPNACLCVDYCGPFPERDGFTWIMVVSCRDTKFVRAFATKSQTAAETAYVLLHGWVLNYGLPNTFLSDQGPSFDNALIKHLAKLLGFSKIFSSPHHQESDGQAERMVQYLANSLRASAEFDVDWVDRLDYICYAYNCSFNPSIKAIPFQLWYGRLPSALTDLDSSALPSGPKDVRDQQQVAYEILVKIVDSCKEAEAQLNVRREQTRKFHDRHVKPKPEYQVGTPVWLFDPNCPKGTSRKLRNPWTGPWLVQSVDPTRRNATLLRHDRPKTRTVHWNRLRLYKAPLAPLEKKLTGRRKAFIYDILRSRKLKGRTEYLARWMNLDNDAPDEWVPASSVPAKLLKRVPEN